MTAGAAAAWDRADTWKGGDPWSKPGEVLRVLRVITVLWWVLPGPCFGACGASANSMRVAALSTAFEPAKLEEGEESLVLRLHPQAHGGPCGPPASPCVARRCCGRSLSSLALLYSLGIPRAGEGRSAARGDGPVITACTLAVDKCPCRARVSRARPKPVSWGLFDGQG